MASTVYVKAEVLWCLFELVDVHDLRQHEDTLTLSARTSIVDGGERSRKALGAIREIIS
jgi:hypothetical protein